MFGRKRPEGDSQKSVPGALGDSQRAYLSKDEKNGLNDM